MSRSIHYMIKGGIVESDKTEDLVFPFLNDCG